MKHRRLLVGTLIAVALALELALICAGQYASLAADGILYVDAGASGANDGTSWADAYTALQPALGAATPGSQIWVAAGTYKPSLEFWPGDPRSAAFQLKNGVALYGGFAGTENSLEERDWATHVTVLSGDLNGDDGPDFANNWDNADHVFYHPAGLNLDGTAILDGFTISGGNAYQYGGGMYNDGSSPALANCTFAGNYGGWDGGGMYNTVGSAPMLVNCSFEDNAANWGGGGMYNILSSSPTLINCTFSGNSAGLVGGGLFSDGSSPTLNNCTFVVNSAGEVGGVYNINYAAPTLTNCILWANIPSQINGTPLVTYSDVQGSYPGEANIDANPRFVNAAGGDYHLGPGSPCRDAGSNDAPDLPALDFEGDARIMDGDGDGTATVDMGVDEAPYEPFPPPAIIFVDLEATGANDGTSWADAFTDFQDALAWAADGVQIWVAEGTYNPTSGDDRGASFQMKNGVAVYGGFDPSVGDVAFGDRDWVNNVTILSGDLNGDDGPDFANNGENSYHVFFHPAGLNLNSSAVLDGFAVSGGNANGAYDNYGGGMYNEGSSPALRNCIFSSNSAGHSGGGLYNFSSSPALTSCSFTGNSAAYYGGGTHNYDSSPTLTNCTFAGNSAGYGYGGGMYNIGYSAPTLTNCTFTGNSAESGGGGMYNAHSAPTLTNCTFADNSVGFDGGGMYNVNYSAPTLTNCTFTGNSAESGGGMNNYDSAPTLTNCTFASNSAKLGGAMYNNYSSPALTNCILWGNKLDQILNCQSTPAVTYSNVQGGYDGLGNIAVKPLFVDLANGDLHLKPDSPCMDAGSNDAPNLPATDFEGDARILDGDGDGMAIVDMGVDEAPYAGPPPAVEVQIDIKPGNAQNVINLLSPRPVPVAILTTGEFDAGTVNPETVRFAGAAPESWAMEDVDRDGDLDLLLWFNARELDLDGSSTEGTLIGVTFDGTRIYGSDMVKMVGHFTSPIMVPVP